MRRGKQSGFTLVELLTVIAIIALLSALILGLAGLAQRKSARSKAEAEITQLESFITDYHLKHGRVPPTVADLQDALAKANHSLSNFTDPWGNPYRYQPSSQVTFYLWSTAGATGETRAVFIGNPP